MSDPAAPRTPWIERCLIEQPPTPMAADETTIDLWLLRGGRDDPRLRSLIAAYAGLPSSALPWAIGPYGKPFLQGHHLRFNLSHSGDWTVLAVANAIEVGVDLEHARRVKRRSALLERSFTDAEHRRLVGGGDGKILRYWAAKEALVKAIGRGIAYGLKQIEIDEAADGQLTVGSLGGSAAPASRWKIYGFEPGEDGFGVLAIEGPTRPLQFFRVAE